MIIHFNDAKFDAEYTLYKGTLEESGAPLRYPFS